MSETVTPRLPRVRIPPRPPEWALVIERFYADSFDARDKQAFLESAEAFAELAPEEQAFHHTHLVFRQLQAMGDIHATLKSIESSLARLDPAALTALRHLPGIRKALVVIAKGQREMLDVLETNGAAPPDDDADEDDDDGLEHAVADDREGDDSEDEGEIPDGEDDASDAEVEEEDHGHGEAALVPDVLPAGSRRGVTAEQVLANRERGES